MKDQLLMDGIASEAEIIAKFRSRQGRLGGIAGTPAQQAARRRSAKIMNEINAQRRAANNAKNQ